MSTWDWIWSGLCLFAWLIIAVGIYIYSKQSGYRWGRQAYKDGLRYNPGWGEDMCRGWKDAQDDYES
jgi:hypothetical protein